MYIFNRTRLARPGKLAEAAAAGLEAGQKATEITGHDVHTWNVRFGAPFGTMMWSVRIDSQAELFEATEKLMVDPSYIEMAMALNDLFEGPTTDNLVRVVSGTPSDTPSRFVYSTQAVMANGRYADAVQFGIEMQEFAFGETGHPNVFGTAVYGGFADVIWLTGADSMEAVDGAQNWAMSNAEYQERVQSAAELFVEGSGQNGLIERLG